MRTEAERTPAWWFMAVLAVTHIPLGLAGLWVDRSFPLGSAAEGGSARIFGVFETNGWHSLAALLLGLFGVYVLRRGRGLRSAALAIGVGHVGIFLSLMVAEPGSLLLASNDADQVIHASTAIGGIATSLLTGRAAETISI